MTSLMYSRLWACGAALAGVLALAACSGDGGAADGASPSTPSVSGDAGSSVSTTPLDGSWFGTAGGEAVVLMVNGKKAALYATGGTVCDGTTDAGAIRLTCAAGTDDRTAGRVDSVDGSTLKVTWESGLGTETYTKAEDGSWPSGLPTATPGA
ncbi:hypothetical protein [Streptomyces sp. NPDC018693]|uniref:hypothetical protein n=1 Tax=unclassified Streptomyces TaxID=2593676 RepID=UPI0037AA2322